MKAAATQRRARLPDLSFQPDLNFEITGAESVTFAAAPLMGFGLRVTNAGTEAIHSIALRCQIMIEPARRQYTPEEQARLGDLFGEPQRWGQTLRAMLWTHAGIMVPGFTGSTLVDLPVPCTYDFNLAVVKYFHGLQAGEIPLCFQFSGSVFYAGEGGYLQVAPISWNKESRFRLPVKTWGEMMDTYYPNSAWLYLRRDVFERLYRHKVRHGLPTWEETLEGLLDGVEQKEVGS
jgi:hypothetical protein